MPELRGGGERKKTGKALISWGPAKCWTQRGILNLRDDEDSSVKYAQKVLKHILNESFLQTSFWGTNLFSYSKVIVVGQMQCQVVSRGSRLQWSVNELLWPVLTLVLSGPRALAQDLCQVALLPLKISQCHLATYTHTLNELHLQFCSSFSSFWGFINTTQ